MKTYFKFLFIYCVIATFGSCDDNTFIENVIDADFGQPRNLVYSEILEAREFSAILTSIPTIDTDGIVPAYEIVSIRKEDGTILDDTYMSFVSIKGYTESTESVKEENIVPGQTGTYSATDSRTNGVISIEDGNNFGIDDYYFTIKASTNINGAIYSEIFEDALHIKVLPQVATLLYSPVAQNLVVGSSTSTSVPYITGGNSEITFGLGSDTDKLEINSETGVISLKSGYSTTENETFYPTVHAISTITGEVTEYQGEGFLWIVASNTPVDLPRVTNYFFQPSFQSVGKSNGYIIDEILLGNPKNYWSQTSPTTLTSVLDPELPEVPNKRGVYTNTVNKNANNKNTSYAHESDVILNSQNLSIFKFGYDLKAVFYTKNQYVEYFPVGDPDEGRTPIDLEIYISTDYNGDNTSATWTQVNNAVTSQIGSGTPFMGTPYPGDQKKADPDGLKDTSKNADGKWVRCELDLNPYKDVSNFTLKFKFASYFTGEVLFKSGTSIRSGRFYISDVFYKAQEE